MAKSTTNKQIEVLCSMFIEGIEQYNIDKNPEDMIMVILIATTAQGINRPCFHASNMNTECAIKLMKEQLKQTEKQN